MARRSWVEWPRFSWLALIVVLVSSFTTFAVIRFIAGYQTERDVVRLETEMDQLFLKYDSAIQSLATKVDVLEFMQYAAKETEPQRRAAVIESWQRNRDAELRKRIESLQRRLMELEKKDEPPLDNRGIR